MRNLLLLFLLLAAMGSPALAQDQPVSVAAPAARYQFTQLKHDGGTMYLLYGAEEYNKKLAVVDAELDQQDRYVRKLHSLAVALNYLSSQGWELVGLTTVPDELSSGSIGSGSNVKTHTDYLLKRRLQL